jgi:hypothetical protein
MENQVTNLSEYKKTLYWRGSLNLDYEIIMAKAEDKIIAPDRPYTPKQGDKLFFTERCTVPRIKLKEFHAKYKTSTTRDPSKANIIVYNQKRLNDLYKVYRSYEIPKEIFIKLLNWFATKGLVSNTEKIEILLKEIESIDTDFILTSWQGNYIASGQHLFTFSGQTTNFNHEYDLDEFISDNYTCIPESNYNIISNILLKYYNQNEILNKLNITVIDHDIYESLCKMFDSTDTDNHVIAMETMANCDYEKSAVYILILLIQYKNNIFYTRTRYHVNFKAMIQFFGLEDISKRYIHYDFIIKILRTKGLLTKENIQILKDIADVDIPDDTPSVMFEDDAEGTQDIDFDDDIFQALCSND